MVHSHKCPHLNSLGAADKAKLRASAPTRCIQLASVWETSGTKVGVARNNASWTWRWGVDFCDSVIWLQPELHRHKSTPFDHPDILFSLIPNCHYEILLKIGRRLVGSVSKCQELQGGLVCQISWILPNAFEVLMWNYLQWCTFVWKPQNGATFKSFCNIYRSPTLCGWQAFRTQCDDLTHVIGYLKKKQFFFPLMGRQTLSSSHTDAAQLNFKPAYWQSEWTSGLLWLAVLFMSLPSNSFSW